MATQRDGTSKLADRAQKAAAIVCFAIAAGLLALTVLKPDVAKAGLGPQAHAKATLTTR